MFYRCGYISARWRDSSMVSHAASARLSSSKLTASLVYIVHTTSALCSVWKSLVGVRGETRWFSEVYRYHVASSRMIQHGNKASLGYGGIPISSCTSSACVSLSTSREMPLEFAYNSVWDGPLTRSFHTELSLATGVIPGDHLWPLILRAKTGVRCAREHKPPV